ncbi:DUF4190 domain-containing protein [Cellulomonas sp. KRMCY2]|uniref:DUF4190 domain-containing protein n=1 Tax=Cellulomonas sp. KRMCY2 TaxID=1304865 RepID=UPI00045E8D75|nr:DUF4190 domain-containing protein [Cellulomonas sp. KRMCY2]
MSIPTDPQNPAPEPGEGSVPGSPPPPYGAQPPVYGEQPPAYGAQPPAYGVQPPVYGAQPPAYGAQPPVYGEQPPAYGAQPPVYGAQPPAYGYGGQPPAYGGPPAYGYGGGTEKNNLGTWALVLGILSIVCCGFLTGIPAVIIGNNSKKAAAQGLANNGNLGNIGMILGWVGIGLSVIGIIWGAANGFNYSYQWGNL